MILNGFSVEKCLVGMPYEHGWYAYNYWQKGFNGPMTKLGPYRTRKEAINAILEHTERK